MFYVAKLHPNEDKQNMLFGGCGDKKVYQFDMNSGDTVQVCSHETPASSHPAPTERLSAGLPPSLDTRGAVKRRVC